ncbi:MAG: hypothetical protein IPO01_10835 [Chitinophagaceae bacterium]|nr:hypothetical protein [Chitinophagaceae bacterium]
MEFAFYIIIILIAIAIILIIVFRPKSNSDFSSLQSKILELQSSLAKIESNLKEDFRINREENATIAKDNRLELNNTLKIITEQSQNALKEINKTLEDKVAALIEKLMPTIKPTRKS